MEFWKSVSDESLAKSLKSIKNILGATFAIVMNRSMRHFAWNSKMVEFLAEQLQMDPELQRMLPLIHIHEDSPRWCHTGERFENEIHKFKMIYKTICERRYNLDAEQKELCMSLSCLRREASNTDASSSRIAAFAQHIANRRVL